MPDITAKINVNTSGIKKSFSNLTQMTVGTTLYN